MDRRYITLGVLLVVSLILVPAAVAHVEYLSAFNTMYGTVKTRLDTCSTCHMPAPNSYALDLQTQLMNGTTVEQSLRNIEPFDSDGDGYINFFEINSRTFPGNSSDYPANTTPTPTPNQPPVANFTYSPSSPVVNETVTFDASISFDPDGYIASYWWNISGNTFTTMIINTSFAEPGTYPASLVVTDNNGMMDSTIKWVDVTASPTPTPTPTNATVTFVVTDSITDIAIWDAAVIMDGTKTRTDADGKAMFTNVTFGSYSYLVSKTGYRRTSGTINVTTDTTVTVKLVQK